MAERDCDACGDPVLTLFIGSAVLVVMGLVKAVITLALAQGTRADLIPGADWWGRVLYPAGTSRSNV